MPRVRSSAAASGKAAIPAYYLYGEPLRAPDERLIHIETVAARSRLHAWNIEPHRHRDLYQVLLIRQGQIHARFDDSNAAPRAPSAIVVPPGVVHAFRFAPETDGFVISFAVGLAREYIDMTPALGTLLEQPRAVALPADALQATDLWRLAELLLGEFARSAVGRAAALRGLLAATLANLLRLAPDDGVPDAAHRRADRELVARFRRTIESRFREHLPLAWYACALGVSAGRLRRACLAATGQPPIELVHGRLLIEAERQLRYTSLPVAKIAHELGFDDAAYFTRFFTRRAGLSPRAFRAQDGNPA
ncbi:MAG: helix-turn-helix domain-containing protein [Steroidobacteraceae bacterium]|nr:helix-turn-helix domain-containing protein [Steroidobacteraceae bacterium]MDW8260761.1 helix-turn-helix domain-containing protein [Gammaproteobacteria bacterium]